MKWLWLATAVAASPGPVTPEAVNDPNVPPPHKGDRGAAVLRAQVLLDRAHFSPGEMDGVAGQHLRQAVAGFQKAHDLPSTGELDDRTWAELNRDAPEILVSYTIADADVAGPFQPVPTEMMDKAKLPAMSYSAPDEALGEKFHIRPEFLAQLNPGKDLARAGEQIVVPNVQNEPALPAGSKVVIDRSDATVSVLDEADRTIAQFPATLGSEHDPLPIGKHKINGVSWNPPFHYNPKLFWDADATDEKATIKPGPNNPVGVVWVDLSIKHYGIHGTPEPRQIGQTESHGCIRLTNWDAMTFAQAVRPGMAAILQP